MKYNSQNNIIFKNEIKINKLKKQNTIIMFCGCGYSDLGTPFNILLINVPMN